MRDELLSAVQEELDRRERLIASVRSDSPVVAVLREDARRLISADREILAQFEDAAYRRGNNDWLRGEAYGLWVAVQVLARGLGVDIPEDQ